MMNLNLYNPRLEEQIRSFVKALVQLSGDNLKSVFLYGGVAKSDYTEGKSNVNMLFIFDSVDLQVLDSFSLLFQQAMAEFRMAPFILTQSEVVPSSDVFAVKLFDIRQHHVLLYGQDLLKELVFDKAYLKFLSEQELRNQLARMKYFYIQNFNLPEQLHQRVQKGFTSLVINANVFLFLKHNSYYATRKEITGRLLKEPEMDAGALSSLLSVKESTTLLPRETIKKSYDDLMVQYKQLIKAYKQLPLNG